MSHLKRWELLTWRIDIIESGEQMSGLSFAAKQNKAAGLPVLPNFILMKKIISTKCCFLLFHFWSNAASTASFGIIGTTALLKILLSLLGQNYSSVAIYCKKLIVCLATTDPCKWLENLLSHETIFLPLFQSYACWDCYVLHVCDLQIMLLEFVTSWELRGDHSSSLGLELLTCAFQIINAFKFARHGILFALGIVLYSWAAWLHSEAT